jgi:hypothetical protein
MSLARYGDEDLAARALALRCTPKTQLLAQQ